MPKHVIDQFQQDEIAHYGTTMLNPDKAFVENLFRKLNETQSSQFKDSEQLYGQAKAGFMCPFCKATNASAQLQQKRSADEPSTYLFTCRNDNRHKWVTAA